MFKKIKSWFKKKEKKESDSSLIKGQSVDDASPSKSKPQEGKRKEEQKKLRHSSSSSALYDKRFKLIITMLGQHTRQLDQHGSMFKHVLKEIKTMKEGVKNFTNTSQVSETVQQTVTEQLTQLEQNLCYVILSIRNETQQEFIELQQIATDLYPEKEYKKIRTTIMNYLKKLENYGLIQRKKVQKKTHVKPTEKMIDEFSKKAVEVKKKKLKQILH